MNINNKDEPNTGPKPDRWYNLTLGSSFKEPPSSKFCTLRYEFKPASIDKNQPGKLHKNKDNRVSVEFQNSQPGKPKVSFEGSSEDYKENDAVLFFDGETFRLERLHRAVKRLKHVRLPGESAAASASASTFVSATAEMSSPPVVKAPTFQSQNNVARALPCAQVEVERIEVGDIKSSDTRPKNGKAADYPSSHANQSNAASPEAKSDDLDEELDILNDDIEGNTGGGDIIVKEIDTGIDINIPHHQNDTDDEIADVDAASDDDDKGRNAAEELRAQVNAQEQQRTSSSSSSSGSESSGSSSSSSSSSSSRSDSSSNDKESSDAETVNSI